MAIAGDEPEAPAAAPHHKETTMELRLDDAQATLLQEVLDSSWRELRYEIADTDNSTFKAELRERGERLRSLLDLVGGPLPDAAPKG